VCQHLMQCRTGALGYQQWECAYSQQWRSPTLKNAVID
jgi:hypothetical protein